MLEDDVMPSLSVGSEVCLKEKQDAAKQSTVWKAHRCSYSTSMRIMKRYAAGRLAADTTGTLLMATEWKFSARAK